MNINNLMSKSAAAMVAPAAAVPTPMQYRQPSLSNKHAVSAIWNAKVDKIDVFIIILSVLCLSSMIRWSSFDDRSPMSMVELR